jgi:hypothetical protein
VAEFVGYSEIEKLLARHKPLPLQFSGAQALALEKGLL